MSTVLKFLENLLRGTGDVARHLDRAGTAMNEGKYDTAVKEYTKVLAADQKNTDALVNRSFAYSELGKFEQAIADCNVAIALDREKAVAYGNRAVARLRMGELRAAILDYDVAIDLNPMLLPAVLGRASVHLVSGDRALAIADFTRALELNPLETEAFFNRGIAYLGSGQFEEALADFTETLRLDSAHARAADEQEFAGRVLAFRRTEECLALTEPAIDAEAIAGPEAANHIRDCIRACREVNSYRTTLIVRDLGCSELESLAYELIRWRGEFLGINGSHVFQSNRLENFPNGADEEWVTVGARQFQKFGNIAECEVERPYSSEIEAFLRVDRYTKLLDSIALSDVVMYTDAANDYLIAVCSIAPTLDLGGCNVAQLRSRFARWLQHMVVQIEGNGMVLELPYGTLWNPEPWSWLPEVAKDTKVNFITIPTVSDDAYQTSIARHHDQLVNSPNPFRLTLWIDRARHYIVKSVLDLDGWLASGEPVVLKVEQVFGDWASKVVVKEPRGLNQDEP